MATKHKPPKKVEPVDIGERFAEALFQKPKSESHEHHDGPLLGDKVTVGNGRLF